MYFTTYFRDTCTYNFLLYSVKEMLNSIMCIKMWFYLGWEISLQGVTKLSVRISQKTRHMYFENKHYLIIRHCIWLKLLHLIKGSGILLARINYWKSNFDYESEIRFGNTAGEYFWYLKTPYLWTPCTSFLAPVGGGDIPWRN